MEILFVVFSFAFILSSAEGFLLNNTGLPSGGGVSLSDKHYLNLVDMALEEKQARRQLEQYVLQLSKELASVKDQQSKQSAPTENCSSLSHDLDIQQNKTELLKDTIDKMRVDFGTIERENRQLISDNQKLLSEISSLKNEFNQWKLSVTGIQISNITYVSEKLKTTDSKLNSLMSSNNARMQDFLALLNQTKESENRIGTLETTQFSLAANLLNQTKESENRISVLETTQYSLASEVRILARNQSVTSHNLETTVSRMNEKVALTSCANDYTGPGTVLFPNHKTVIGIRNISEFDRTGQFTCESGGLYLVSVYILSQNVYSYFDIYVNSNYLTSFRVKGSDGGGSNYNTGTAVVLVSLKENDKVSIHDPGYYHVYGSLLSCLSILKIK